MTFSVATYNVENLFAGRDARERAWVRRKLEVVVAKLRECDADVIGLQEVGDVALLDSIALGLEPEGYRAVAATPDARGIRCAILSRRPLASWAVHVAESLPFPAFALGDPPPFGDRIPLRRGVVHVAVDAAALGRVHVFVAHFKSALPTCILDANGLPVSPSTAKERAEGFVRSLVWRAAEALHLRGLVDAVLDVGAHAVAMGDFNDTPSSAVIRSLSGGAPGEAGALVDCTSSVPEGERYSVVGGGRKHQIDHVWATADLSGRVLSARFLNRDLVDREDASPKHEPRTESDHAPLVVRFGTAS